MRLYEFFMHLNEAARPQLGISPYRAAKLVAQDDDLFDTIASYTVNASAFEDNPEHITKFAKILNLIKPYKKRLWRGELEGYHPTRPFTSWSANQNVAQSYFASERGHKLYYTDGPVKAVSLSDIALARTRMSPGESHYPGMQAEHFVLEPVERKSINSEGQVFEVSSDEEHRKAKQETGFWGRAAAGGLFLARDTGRLLFNHRSVNVLEPNTWGVWGGAIDQDEDPAQAVSREAAEEAGITVRSNDIIPLYVFKHPSGFRYFNFLILVDHEFEPRPSPEHAWETQGYDWVEFGDWPSPLHPGVISLLKDQRSLQTIRTAIGK